MKRKKDKSQKPYKNASFGGYEFFVEAGGVLEDNGEYRYLGMPSRWSNRRTRMSILMATNYEAAFLNVNFGYR